MGYRDIVKWDISIHALRKESDNIDIMVINSLEISIHALRKESDHRQKP